ncbi:WD40-repeat-containing domain protein [Aspergillus pseudoustus]|uniref:WD40-repeat-containing domain protein n=1 Tax=Aspergillus pseudoustus TaxID=1810923 RepID=A0ABR4ICR9_9EURO
MIRNCSMSRYSAAPSLLGSEDPLMIRESEDLLSQFMRSSSHESHDNHAQPQIAQKTTPAAMVGQRASPKTRIKIPRSKVQLRPETELRVTVPRTQSPADTSIKKEIHPSPISKEKLPTHPRRVSPPVIDLCESSSVASASLSSDNDNEPKPVAPRRSRRAREGPTNYYKKTYHLDSESEEEDQILSSSRELPHRGRRTLQSSSTTPSLPPPSNHQATGRQQNISLRGLLQQRELGRYPNVPLQSQLGGNNFKLSRAWKGASNDVITLTWSPDGTKFAAGATAHCDEHMMAYNRKNNLVLGDLASNELHELPDHWMTRRLLASNNQDHAVNNDPRLFMSVSSVQWYGDTLYTASYDHTVKLWDTTRRKATCFKTLEHASQVIVMARSNFAENILATGTTTIGLWNTEALQYTELELPRPRSKKDIELAPTSISWGSNHATKHFLLAGMSDKEDSGVAQHGLLAAFRVSESSIEPENFSPNSQNVFDVAWHPTLPTFATACTAGQQAPRGTRSVVNIYEPLRHNRRVLDLDCPAQDMNEVVFCPLNTNYISASCTDGATYVWDQRNPGEILHKLEHGYPLNQIDETIPRELADTGVTLHTWGSTYEQLYTGGSDGVLKRWNIFRATEDVLVEDVANLQEGIMCGALAPDKSNLLVGDVSGGVQLLSSSPFSPEEEDDDDDDDDGDGDGEPGRGNNYYDFAFIESTPVDQSNTDLDSGVKAARELIATGQITRHPVFGPGQGPYYKGPFAAWARSNRTPPDQISTTPLAEKYSTRQLDVPIQSRRELNPTVQRDIEAHIALAKIRNQKRGCNKRRNSGHITIKKDGVHGDNNPVNLVHLCEMSRKRKQQELLSSGPDSQGAIMANIGREVIDLTGDSSEEEPAASSVEDVLDHLEDDFWWPCSGTIDPNWPKEP